MRVFWNQQEMFELAVATVLLKLENPMASQLNLLNQAQQEILPSDRRRNLRAITLVPKPMQEMMESLYEDILTCPEPEEVKEAGNEVLTDLFRRAHLPLDAKLENLTHQVRLIETTLDSTMKRVEKAASQLATVEDFLLEVMAKLDALSPKEPKAVDVSSGEASKPENTSQSRNEEKLRIYVIGCHRNLEVLLQREFPTIEFIFIDPTRPHQVRSLVQATHRLPVLMGVHKHSTVRALLTSHKVKYQIVSTNHPADWYDAIHGLLLATVV